MNPNPEFQPPMDTDKHRFFPISIRVHPRASVVKSLFALFSASVLTLLCLSACGKGSSPVSAQPEKPNIIFILADDLGKEWIRAYGAEDIETPAIDRLAKEGIRFENFYVMPQCTPTRLSLMTGQYPFRHGWVNHWDVPRWGGGAHFDSSMNPSVARMLQSAGYKTAVAGKWQVKTLPLPS